MILSSADNVKVGNTQVSSVRLGSVQIWPAENAVFNFVSQAGTAISLELTVQNSTVTVDWGDGTSDDYTVGNNSKSHTYS
jgi:hypothetical protein